MLLTARFWAGRRVNHREQLAGTMFDIPDPPTGPAKRPASANTFRGYLHWRGTPDGEAFWAELVHRTLRLHRSGAQRISVNRLHDDVRGDLKIEANNTYRPWLADDLCRRWPELMAVIERRKRRKAG